MHLDGHEVAGFEALARWRDRSGRNRSAAEFIEVAEQTGLISQIDHEMLRKSCRFIAEFNEHRLDREPAWVSVNLSTQELAARDLSTRIASVLAETGIDPSWLTIELTEGDSRLELRSERKPKEALGDFREIRLTPVAKPK